MQHTVLNAVVIGSYRDFLEETYKNTSQDTLKLITQAKDLLGIELKKLEGGLSRTRFGGRKRPCCSAR